MAKTYGALKRAEEEKGIKAEIPPVTDGSWERESSSPSFQEFPGVEVLPALPKRRALRNLSLLVEEFQRMKHKIIHFDLNRVMKAILFSSPGPGEGNSTILIHFAQTLAAEGNQVLLVDGNMRNPSIHRAFHLPKENGLTDLAFSPTNIRNVDHYIKETNLDNLKVITSGNPHPNPCSIFDSPFLGVLNDHLRIQWDWILFDSPPVVSYSDSMAMGCEVDGIVMVVQAEKTRWEVAQHARERLESCGGRVIGVVLNKRRFYIPNWIYKKL